MTRPSFPSIYMRLAEMMSERSTCCRLKVGCAIVTPDYRKVLSVGYNGNVSGGANDCDVHGEAAVGACGCLHAEENAVINCDVPRDVRKVVFCTHLPCLMCAKRLINMGGVRGVFYLNDYRKRDSLELLNANTIIVGHFSYDDPEDKDLWPAQERAKSALRKHFKDKFDALKTKNK